MGVATVHASYENTNFWLKFRETTQFHEFVWFRGILPDIDFFHRDSDGFDSMDKGDIHHQHRGKLFHIYGIHNLIFFDISLDIAIHLHCNLSIFGFFDIYIIEHSFCYKEGIRLHDKGLNIYVARKTIIFHMVFHKTKIFQSIF